MPDWVQWVGLVLVGAGCFWAGFTAKAYHVREVIEQLEREYDIQLTKKQEL